MSLEHYYMSINLPTVKNMHIDFHYFSGLPYICNSNLFKTFGDKRGSTPRLPQNLFIRGLFGVSEFPQQPVSIQSAPLILGRARATRSSAEYFVLRQKFCCDFNRGFSDAFINMAKICLGWQKRVGGMRRMVWSSLLPFPCGIPWYSSSMRTGGCHIVTLGFSAEVSSDFLQVPWERRVLRAEACSG